MIYSAKYSVFNSNKMSQKFKQEGSTANNSQAIQKQIQGVVSAFDKGLKTPEKGTTQSANAQKISVGSHKVEARPQGQAPTDKKPNTSSINRKTPQSQRQTLPSEAHSPMTTEHNTTVLDEKEQDEIMQRNEDDLMKIIFKSKEVEFNQGAGAGGDSRTDRLSADDSFEIKFKDSNGRNIIHRSALEQRHSALEQVFRNLETVSEDSIKLLLEQKDKYGNTALGLACVYNYPDSRKTIERFEVVKLLVRKKANPNVCNPTTLFTPMHWACVHGANDIVNHLLQAQNQACQYIPDRLGYFPIDYAGEFKHHQTVKTLIQHHLDSMDKVRRQYALTDTWELLMAPYIDQNGRAGKFAQAIENPVLMFNPIFHTSMLYWAAMFKEIEIELMERILNELEAYPEGPVAIDKWRTPCHAASQVGNAQKLDKLLQDIYSRYKKDLKPGEERTYSKKQICTNFQVRWQTLLKQRRYQKLKIFNDTVFQEKLLLYKSMKKFKFDFNDRFTNTPLHIASQNGNDICAKMLIEQYDLSLDLRNIEGWMPKDIVQHDNINKVYLRFFKTLDQKYSSIVSAATNAAQGPPVPMVTAGGGMTNSFLTQQSMSQLQNSSAHYQKDPKAIGNDAFDDAQQEGTTDLTEKQIVNKELIKCRALMPQLPPLVLKVDIKESQVVNKMIELLEQSGFTIQMFPSLNPSFYYITLKLRQSILEKEAKFLELRIKLCDIDSKKVFEPTQKARYEPFRSKDVQKIMLSLIARIVNVQQLKQQKILVSIIPMHDFYGIHEIKTKWYQRSRFFPMPFPVIRDFYKENMNFQYSEISAIKNYFGEKMAFEVAFMSYYTSWLIIPGFFGLALSIYQFMTDVDTVFTSLYAIIVSIWVTIFIEKWKRKSSEISLKWGISQFSSSSTTREVREEFNGDEYFSHVNNQIDKRNVQTKFLLILILSIPVFVMLIGACIAMFFGTIQLKTKKTGIEEVDRFMGTIAGIINGIVIAIINFIYQKLATLFVNLENHKYQDTYENSFVFKLFAFKFVNTNISLFYTAFVDQDFNGLYFLLLGMIIQKSIQILLLKQVNCNEIYRNGLKTLKFIAFKFLYFKKVASMAKEQAIQHSNHMEELMDKDPYEHDQLEKEKQEFRMKPLFNKLDGVKYPIFSRLVFNINSTVEKKQVLLDYVELNSIMPERSDLQAINEISEVFILFGLATLYSCACPIASLIVMVHNVVDINFDLFVNYATTRRPLPKVSTNIGPWLSIAGFMALATVISNCVLLYFSTKAVRNFMENQLQLNSDLYLLWIIVAIEHAILLVKGLTSAIIKDVPDWVEKSQLRIEHEHLLLRDEEDERKDNEKLKQVKTSFQRQGEHYKEMFVKFKSEIKRLKESNHQKDQQLKILNKERSEAQLQKQQQEENSKGVKIIQEIQREESLKKKPEDMKLLDFIGVSTGEWLGSKRGFELERSLNRMFQVRLMRQTFMSFEREIIARRVSKLHETKRFLQINCVQCTTKFAVQECLECQDHFCQQCSLEVHSSSQVFMQHRLVPLVLEPLGQMLTSPPQAKLAPTGSQQSGSKLPHWKKFEYYNFPLQQDNDLHLYIQKHFVYLREHYITRNYIESADKIHYQGLFVDRHYDLLTDIQGKILSQQDRKMFANGPMPQQYQMFNDEELYFMNRVAFYLYKHKSDNLDYQHYIMRLKILQSAPFKKRFTLWLTLLDDRGDEVLERTQLEQAIRFTYVQDMNGMVRDSDILKLIYGGEDQQQAMTINKIIEAVMSDERIVQFFSCVIQFNPAEVLEF